MEFIGELELRGESYGFDLFRLEYNPDTKRYRVGTDSGCSCPACFASSPFEDGRGEYVDNLSYRQVLALLDSEMAASTVRHQGWFVDAHRSLRQRLNEHGKEHDLLPH